MFLIQPSNPKCFMGRVAMGHRNHEREFFRKDRFAILFDRFEHGRPFAGRHQPGIAKAESQNCFGGFIEEK